MSRPRGFGQTGVVDRRAHTLQWLSLTTASGSPTMVVDGKAPGPISTSTSTTAPSRPTTTQRHFGEHSVISWLRSAVSGVEVLTGCPETTEAGMHPASQERGARFGGGSGGDTEPVKWCRSPLAPKLNTLYLESKNRNLQYAPKRNTSGPYPFHLSSADRGIIQVLYGAIHLGGARSRPSEIGLLLRVRGGFSHAETVQAHPTSSTCRTHRSYSVSCQGRMIVNG